MNIRPIEVNEFEKLIPLAMEFIVSSDVLKGFNYSHFEKMWSAFIDQGIGIIFGLFDDEKIVGGLGAIAFGDMHTGNLVAHECFWFVGEENRGEGLKLLEEYEAWAKHTGCKSIIVTHLVDSMPERVARIYRMRGYKIIETNYRKEVS